MSSSSSNQNSFNRQRSDHFNSIFIENDITRVDFFEIKRLLNKREIARRYSKYLINWKNYEFQYNEWKNLSKLKNVMNLIKNAREFFWENFFDIEWNQIK